MRSARLAHLLLLGTLLGSAALAQSRKPQEFQAPRQMSEEEIEAAKRRSKLNPDLHDYGKDVTAEVKPIPWMAVGLIGMVFLVALPFALRAYRDTANEIRAANPNVGLGGGGGAPRPPRRPTPRPPPPA